MSMFPKTTQTDEKIDVRTMCMRRCVTTSHVMSPLNQTTAHFTVRDFSRHATAPLNIFS